MGKARTSQKVPENQPELLLNHPEGNRRLAFLTFPLDLAPMRISVQPIITHRDLALVGNMRDDPGDELLESLGIARNARAEELSPEALFRLFLALRKAP